MLEVNGNYSNYYGAAGANSANTAKSKGTGASKADNAKQSAATSQTQLSSKAQSVLDKLKGMFSDMDFFVADFNGKNEAKEILSRGSKEFSVLFSSDDLEKMATDDKFLQERISSIKGAVRMSGQINQQFGFESQFGKGGAKDADMVKFGMAFNDDGSVSYFAELEKSSAQQKERIEQAREKRAQDKKTAQEDKIKQNLPNTKKASVEASSMKELMEKIRQIDWTKVKEEKAEVSGGKFDFSI